MSTLKADDKALLVELISLARPDEGWICWPSVERLCRVRGIKYEKNFRGADRYLPGLVEVFKDGRKNKYRLNHSAISQLPVFEVTIKHTPNPYAPAVADDAPVLAVEPPAAEVQDPSLADDPPYATGANRTLNNTLDRTLDRTDEQAPVPGGPGLSQESSTSVRKDVTNSSTSSGIYSSGSIANAPSLETPSGVEERSRTSNDTIAVDGPSGISSLTLVGSRAGGGSAGDAAGLSELRIQQRIHVLRKRYKANSVRHTEQDLRRAAIAQERAVLALSEAERQTVAEPEPQPTAPSRVRAQATDEDDEW